MIFLRTLYLALIMTLNHATDQEIKDFVNLTDSVVAALNTK